MEEMKNGMISEEALDEVAGGLQLNKGVLKKVLLGAGVAIGSFVAGTGVGFGGKYLYDKKFAKSESTNSTLIEDEKVVEVEFIDQKLMDLH